MDHPLRRFQDIMKAVSNETYKDLGKTELICTDNPTLDIIKIKVIPHEGIHKDIEYIITIKFQELGKWPLVYIDSDIYDKIKTAQYLQNRGYDGDHKGICIKSFSTSYGFANFKRLCDNKWENYIYYLITVFNNLEDFEKGVGIRSDYKTILNL